jgi:Holliday junction resolvase RusA-like endonuclease
MEYQQTLLGKPIPQPRPKICALNAKSKWFKKPWLRDIAKESKQDLKSLLRYGLISSNKSIPFMPKECPVEINLKFYLPRPNNHFRANNRTQCIVKLRYQHEWPSKPDIDNLVKYVLDASNAVLYVDDKQVVKLTAIKVYDDMPAVNECNGFTNIFIKEANIL